MFVAPGIFLGYFFLKEFVLNRLPHVDVLHLSRKDIHCLCIALWHIFSLVVILLTFYFTYSYAAWISILATSAFLFILKYPAFSRTNAIKIALTFFLILILFFATQLHNPKFSDLLSGDSRSSFASRITIWDASLKMIANNSVFGIGAGNFQNTYLTYQKYFLPYLEWAVPQPHNLFLAFWLEAGAIGLTGFAMIIYCIFSSLVGAIKKRQAGDLAYLFIAFFLCILLHGLIDTTYWKNDLSFLFWTFTFTAVFILHESKNDTI
jgi:O-antigen ligase